VKVLIDGIRNPSVSPSEFSSGLFNITPVIKIFDKTTDQVLFEKSSFDYSIDKPLPSVITMDSAFVTSYYLANSIPFGASDPDSNKIISVSDNTVGSTNIDIVLKVICDQDIRPENLLDGNGQFDYLIVKLSQNILVYPEHPIGIFTLKFN
jgi:hypothetical protein